MDEIKKRLIYQKKVLEKAIAYAEGLLKNSPQGVLRVVRKNPFFPMYLLCSQSCTYLSSGSIYGVTNQELIGRVIRNYYILDMKDKAKW